MPRILGLDYGQRRLGFAVSDPDGIVATPLCVIERTSDRQALQELARLCGETGAEKIVVGLPVHMDGRRGEEAERVSAFAERAAARLGVPVETWDERLTTRSAERVLIEAGTSRRRRKEVVDKLAAQIMLQNYLDAHAPLPEPPDEN